MLLMLRNMFPATTRIAIYPPIVLGSPSNKAHHTELESGQGWGDKSLLLVSVGRYTCFAWDEASNSGPEDMQVLCPQLTLIYKSKQFSISIFSCSDPIGRSLSRQAKTNFSWSRKRFLSLPNVSLVVFLPITRAVSADVEFILSMTCYK